MLLLSTPLWSTEEYYEQLYADKWSNLDEVDILDS